MSYAAAGLAGGIQNGLGMISQALMGIQQRKLMEAKLAQQAEQDRIAAEDRQYERMRYNAENGITEGFTPTTARLGGATVSSEGTTGSPLSLPSNVMAGAKLKGPGGVMPTGSPSPLAMASGGPAGIGMQPRRLKGLPIPGEFAGDEMERPGVPEEPEGPGVTFGGPTITQDFTKGLAYQRAVAADQIKADREAADRARIQQEEAPQRAALVAQLPPNLQGAGAALDLASLRDLVVKVGTKDPKAPKDPVNWQTIETADGFVQVNPETGEQRPLTGLKPKPKAGDGPNDLNGEQAKAVQFYQRGTGALSSLEKLVNAGSVPGYGSRLAGAVPIFGNAMKGDNARLYDATANEFVTAILRKDSGATITDNEMDMARQMYIPQAGDDPATIKQKLTAARRALESIKATAGPGQSIIAGGPAADAPKSYSPDNPFAPR